MQLRRAFLRVGSMVLACAPLLGAWADAAFADGREESRAAVRSTVDVDPVPTRRLARRAAYGRYCVPDRSTCPTYWYQTYFRPSTSQDRWSLATSTAIAVTSPLILTLGNHESIDRSSDSFW